MCGMSVVADWEKLKRFNLAQIQETVLGDQSNPKPQGPGSKANATAITPRPGTVVGTSAKPTVEPTIENSTETVQGEVTQSDPQKDAVIATEAVVKEHAEAPDAATDTPATSAPKGPSLD